MDIAAICDMEPLMPEGPVRARTWPGLAKFLRIKCPALSNLRPTEPALRIGGFDVA